MPKTKPVKSLQDHCILNILKNLNRHSQVYKGMCKGGERKNTSYKILQRPYTQKMFRMLADREIVKDEVCAVTRNEFIEFDFQGNSKEAEDYLTFLFNPYCTVLDLSISNDETRFDQRYNEMRNGDNGKGREDFTYRGIEKRTIVLSPLILICTVQDIGKNLTEVNLRSYPISEDNLTTLLKSIPNVLNLNLSKTNCCNDHLSVLRQYCPLLLKLDISSTDISDDGIKLLCANPSQRHGDVCKVSFLNIERTAVTLTGAKIILQSLPFLENISCDISRITPPSLHRESFIWLSTNLDGSPKIIPVHFERFNETHNVEAIFCLPLSISPRGIPWILFQMHQENLERNKLRRAQQYMLKEIVFRPLEIEEKILEFVSSSCPEIKSLTFNSAIQGSLLSLCTTFPLLTHLELTLHCNVPSSECLELFTVRGNRLESLSLSGEFESVISDFQDLLNWLELCPKLKEFALKHVNISGNDIYENRTRLFKDAKSLKDFPLRKLAFSNVEGSGIMQLMSTLLLSAVHLEFLHFKHVHPRNERSFDQLIKEVQESHEFRHLRQLEIFQPVCDLNMLYNLLRIDNLEYLAYPFSEFGQMEVYERMREVLIKENLDICIKDKCLLDNYFY